MQQVKRHLLRGVMSLMLVAILAFSNAYSATLRGSAPSDVSQPGLMDPGTGPGNWC